MYRARDASIISHDTQAIYDASHQRSTTLALQARMHRHQFSSPNTLAPRSVTCSVKPASAILAATALALRTARSGVAPSRRYACARPIPSN